MKERIEGVVYPMFEKLLVGLGVLFMFCITYLLTVFFLGLFPVLFGIWGWK